MMTYYYTMEALNTFLSLVSKTEGRDKVLRLFQYLCLHAAEDQSKGGRFKVYEQMRMTRKMLRFLRTLEYLAKIKSQLSELTKSFSHYPSLLKHTLSILHNLFTFLYLVADHRVCLSELNVTSHDSHALQTKRSLQFYMVKSILAILLNITCMVLPDLKGKDTKEMKKQMRANKHYAFDMIRCVLDCLVALHYWGKAFSAKTAGVMGVVSTLMGIMQCLQKM